VLDSITSGLVGVSSRDFFSVDAPRKPGDKMGTIFTMPAPKKIREGKKVVQNFAQFLTTFDFDREYLRNGSTYQKSEKLLIIYNPSHVGRKTLRLRILWFKNEKVIDSAIFTP